MPSPAAIYSTHQWECDESHHVIWATHESERFVPLLSSTKKVLAQLQHQYPGGPEITAEKPDITAESSPEGDNDVEKEEADDAPDGDKAEGDEDEPETDGEKESPEFRSHHRITESYTNIVRALTHIETFYREHPSKESTKSGKDRSRKDRFRHREQSRQAALEARRDRLQKQLERKQMMDVDDEQQDEDLDEDQRDPMLHMVQVLNSLSLLMPILTSIADHPRRNDKQLSIAGVKIKGKRKDQAKCWLLGERIFDVIKVSSMKKIVADLDRAYRVVSGDREDLAKDTAARLGTLDTVMRSLLFASVKGGCFPQSEIASLSRPISELVGANSVTTPLSSSLDDILGLSIAQVFDERRNQFSLVVNFLHGHMSNLLKRIFPDSTLSIYGSCLSELSLGTSSDVDLSLYIESAQRSKDNFEAGKMGVQEYQRSMKNNVYRVCRFLQVRENEFQKMTPIVHARVPVVSGTYMKSRNPYSETGALDFDICFLNDIAVVNSTLLREYSLVDPRSKALMIAVARWGKENKLSSAKDNMLSSYGWKNLVVYFLQWIQIVPNLQDEELLEKCGVVRNIADRWSHINNLDTVFVRWCDAQKFWTQPEHLADITSTELLYRFFHFYAYGFPRHIFAASVKRGHVLLLPKTVFGKCCDSFVIEDPFETYDSHSPHDLGRHASPTSTIIIVERLKQAECHLRSVVQKALAGQTIQSEMLPWPPAPVGSSNPPSNDNGGGKGSGKRSRKGGKKEAAKPAKPKSPRNSAPEAKSNDSPIDSKSTQGNMPVQDTVDEKDVVMSDIDGALEEGAEQRSEPEGQEGGNGTNSGKGGEGRGHRGGGKSGGRGGGDKGGGRGGGGNKGSGRGGGGRGRGGGGGHSGRGGRGNSGEGGRGRGGGRNGGRGD